MKPLFLASIISALLQPILVGCKKQTQDIHSSEICTALGNGEFSSAEPAINRYLRGQRSNLSDQQKLEGLTAWLNKATCISDAQISCNSCIETLPPISHIRFSVNLSGQPTEQIIDIMMENPLRLVRFHE